MCGCRRGRVRRGNPELRAGRRSPNVRPPRGVRRRELGHRGGARLRRLDGEDGARPGFDVARVRIQPIPKLHAPKIRCAPPTRFTRICSGFKHGLAQRRRRRPAARRSHGRRGRPRRRRRRRRLTVRRCRAVFVALCARAFLLRRSAWGLDVFATLSAVSGGNASASAAASFAMDVSNALGSDRSAPPRHPLGTPRPAESPPRGVAAVGAAAATTARLIFATPDAVVRRLCVQRLSKLSLAFSGLGLGTGASAPSASGSSASRLPDSTRSSRGRIARGRPWRTREARAAPRGISGTASSASPDCVGSRGPRSPRGDVDVRPARRPRAFSPSVPEVAGAWRRSRRRASAIISEQHDDCLHLLAAAAAAADEVALRSLRGGDGGSGDDHGGGDGRSA